MPLVSVSKWCSYRVCAIPGATSVPSLRRPVFLGRYVCRVLYSLVLGVLPAFLFDITLESLAFREWTDSFTVSLGLATTQMVIVFYWDTSLYGKVGHTLACDLMCIKQGKQFR